MSIRLSCVEKNKTCLIKSININDKDIQLWLKNIGFAVGKRIIFLCKNFGNDAYLILLENVKFAIDKKICDKVQVEYE